MSNPLTGDYEGVVQIAIRQINGLLGTIHQNAATEDAALKLLHSTTLRIGDPRRRRPEVAGFGDWLLEYQKASPGRRLHDVRAELVSAAVPGARRMLSEALATFYENWSHTFEQVPVRGTVKAQLSIVTIAVPDGSSSEVTVNARVRAHYYPDPDTTDLPAPINGEVQAAFEVRKVQTPSGTRLLIRPASEDAKIRFVAVLTGTGLTPADSERLSVEFRKALRESLILLPIDLPADFPFTAFKGLGTGPSQAIALPMQLSGASPPASGVQSITQSFIGSDGFAFAVSDQYVGGLVDVGAIREAIKSRTVVFSVKLSPWGPTISATYRFRFSSGPKLTFKNGGIEISGRVEVETSTWAAPNGFVSFKQLVTLVLDTSTQFVSLQRAGDPDVDESWFIPHGTAVNIVKSEIDKALSANTPAIRRMFTDTKSALINALSTFDPSANVSFTAVQIGAHGIVVRGEIGSAARRAPVVEIDETHQGTAFTAFQSWIPAGNINRFIWSWIEYTDFSILSGVQKSFADVHRFIFPKPTGITRIDQICLRIEGTRVLPNGEEASIAGGGRCQLSEPEFAIDIPSWWEPLTLPIWRPDVTETTTLRGAIAGHVSVQRNRRGRGAIAQNTLVYFADWSLGKPLDSLRAALGYVRNSSAFMLIVVLPAGAFDATRQEFEEKLASGRERVGASMQFTEDDEGGWTRTFAVKRKPSIYFINARGEFVWHYEGEPDRAALAAALDKHFVPPPVARFRPLLLTVSTGDAAPDALFEDDRENQFAIHRFRGRDVLLNFWQSWSAPCLEELGRLQRLQEDRRGTPSIVAFHGGKNSAVFEDVRKRLGLSFPLVQDPHHRIARLYGVRCWPTTIRVGADGRLEHIQLGKGTAHEHVPGREQAQSA